MAKVLSASQIKHCKREVALVLPQFIFPDFEKNQLFHLRADLPHSWVFPEHSCRRNRNPSIFGNLDFLREMLKWYCPTAPNFFSDGKVLPFFG